MSGELLDERTAPTCAGCDCFRANLTDVPTDEGPRDLCFLCAHFVGEHRIKLARIQCSSIKPESATYRDEEGNLRIRIDEDHVCLHARTAIYPREVCEQRDAYRAALRQRTADELAREWPAAVLEADRREREAAQSETAAAA